jgi:very-short-patch-repair endonuclease
MIKRFIVRDGKIWDNLRQECTNPYPTLGLRKSCSEMNKMTIYQVKPIDYLKERLKKYKLVVVENVNFFSNRKWEFDAVILDSTTNLSTNIAVEIEGMQGRHQSNKGFVQDMLKYNCASVLGYRLLRFTTKDLLTNYPTLAILATARPFQWLQLFDECVRTGEWRLDESKSS